MGFYEARFPVNEELLQMIASHTHGQYFRASSSESILASLSEIMDSLDTAEFQESERNEKTELALFVIAIGLILGMAACFLYMLAIRRYL